MTIKVAALSIRLEEKKYVRNKRTLKIIIKTRNNIHILKIKNLTN